SLHDALPIYPGHRSALRLARRSRRLVFPPVELPVGTQFATGYGVGPGGRPAGVRGRSRSGGAGRTRAGLVRSARRWAPVPGAAARPWGAGPVAERCARPGGGEVVAARRPGRVVGAAARARAATGAHWRLRAHTGAQTTTDATAKEVRS